MQTEQIVSIVTNIIVAFSAAITAFFATNGLNTWKQELVGRNDYELAKRIIKVLYMIKESFNYVRSPFMMSHEYPPELRDEMKNNPINLKRKEIEAQKFAYENRLKMLFENMNLLESESIEAQVIWDKEFKEHIKPLKNCVYTLQERLWIKFDDSYPDDSNIKSRLDDIIYSGLNGDKFAIEIDKAIENIEKVVRPHLGKPKKK